MKKNNDNKKNIIKKKKNKIFTKKNILLFYIPFAIFIIIYFANNNSTILKLKEKIKSLESKIKKMEIELDIKKVGIAFVSKYFYMNRITRFLIVICELLVKTGKYDVYLITEESNNIEFNYNKKIKRIILKNEYQEMKDFDDENNIQIYILNNEIGNPIEIYHSFGKKVIGIYHGVFLSNIFNNLTDEYRSFQEYPRFDSFIHLIPDDYWVYKKFGFNNTIYIPNIITFEGNDTPSSPLTYKNLLMVGRLKLPQNGAKYGILAMSEIIKKVPDARLTIVGSNPTEDLIILIKELKLENNVYFSGFSTNISEFYLNSSILLMPSVSESYPLVMNEGKAYGLPIIAFNIDYNPSYRSGVIIVEMFDYISMANEAIKLLKNYEYRKKKGEEAKSSLLRYESNQEIVEMWDKLFSSLMNSTEDYNILQREFEKKYYNEKLAKKHIKKHFYYGIKFNKYFRCHSFENFTTLEYLNNIKECKTKYIKNK